MLGVAFYVGWVHISKFCWGRWVVGQLSISTVLSIQVGGIFLREIFLLS